MPKNELHKDPFTGTVFVFQSRKADRLKLLYLGGTGLVMAYKRLEDHTFIWPAIKEGVMNLYPHAICSPANCQIQEFVHARRIFRPH